MAILKSLIIRGGRKQIGGMVLYNRMGETIARELAPQIANPRTTAQMEQRIKLSNLVSVYRANSSWMRGAFESKGPRESDYNAFVSANVEGNAVSLKKSDVAAGAAVVGPYKVTSGSLPVIETVLNGQDLATNLYVGALAIGSTTTVGEVSTALLANNNGLVAGMQISVVINLQLASAGTGVPYITTRAYEMIIDPESAALVTDVMPDGILTSIGQANKALGLLTSTLGDGAAAFILSHTVGGSTRVSTQSLVFFGSNATYRAFTTPQAKAAAIASYGEGVDTFLSSNTAGTSQAVEGTISLLGLEVAGREVVSGRVLSNPLAANDTVKFLFNRALPDGAILSAYYKNGNNATQYALTNVSLGADGRSITSAVGSTALPAEGQNITFVAVINGDEYPMTVENAHEGGIE